MQERHNLLRAVRRESWGQERKTLVHLTLSLVRSRLLFGSQAFFSLPSSHMQRLAAVECTALRLAFGLPRGVPQRRVYNEAGVLPLWHCIRSDLPSDSQGSATTESVQRSRSPPTVALHQEGRLQVPLQLRLCSKLH